MGSVLTSWFKGATIEKGNHMESVDFGSTAGVRITVLVDNRADLIVEDRGPVKYFTDQPLLAEHGFSALVQLAEGKTILWDAGKLTSNG